jgi:hypothetical protein
MSFIYNSIKSAGNYLLEIPGKITGAICSRLVSSETQEKISNLKTSLLGQKVIAVTAENCAEFVGYYGGAMLVAPLGKAAGGILMSKVASLASLALTSLTAVGGACAIRDITSASENRALICAITFSILSYLMHATCFAALSNWGESMGEVLGELFTYTGAGILSAFAGIKYFKSEEEFFDQDISRTYPFKTLLSMLACTMIEYAGFFPSNAVLSGVANLVMGSLIYNMIDLKDLFQRTSEGTLLNYMLPQSIDVGALELLYKKALEEGTVRTVKALPHIQSFIPKKNSLKRLVGKKLTIMGIKQLTGPIQKMIEQQIKEQIRQHVDIDSLAATLSENSGSQLKDFVAAVVFGTVIRSINLYCHLLTTYPGMLESYEGNSDEMQKFALEWLKQASELSGNQCSFVDLAKEHVLDVAKAGALKTAFEKAINQFYVPPATLEMIAKTVVSQLSAQEVKTVGFEVLTKEQQAQAEKTLQRHIEWICKMIPLVAPGFAAPYDESEVRQFYKNGNFLISSHYEPALGTRFSGAIESLMNHQIEHSSLI